MVDTGQYAATRNTSLSCSLPPRVTVCELAGISVTSLAILNLSLRNIPFIRVSLPTPVGFLFHEGIVFHSELVRVFQNHGFPLYPPALRGCVRHPYSGASFLWPFQPCAAGPIFLPAAVADLVVEHRAAFRAVQLPAQRVGIVRVAFPDIPLRHPLFHLPGTLCKHLLHLIP